MKIFNSITPQPVDVVIASVPWTMTTFPLLAPSILKSIAVKEGHTAVGLDCNANAIKWVENHPHGDKIIDFFHNETYHEEILEDLYNFFKEFAEMLLAHQPKVVALSLMTYVCQPSTRYLCYFLKRLQPNVVVVIGGPGGLENLRGHSTFSDELRDSGLIDHYIRGDGEKSFAAFLRNDYTFPGINNADWQLLTNEELDSFPYPDYDNYNFELYNFQCLPMLASRGCVRKCKFCDVIEHWKKFSWRDGASVFQEMLTQYKRYGIRNFKFQDSLINGNLKEYKKLITLLAEYNEANPEESFTWSSFFIFRPTGAFGEEWWELTAKSGAKWLNIGIESVVEPIRYHMGKHFSNEDIDFSLQMGRKYGIQFVWLMIVGYVTETQKDIDYTAQWFRDHVEYQDIMKIQFGGTLGIFPNTWLDRHKEELNVISFGPPYQKWNNPVIGSTPELRAEWHRYLSQTCKDLGYQLFEDIDNHYILELLMNGHV